MVRTIDVPSTGSRSSSHLNDRIRIEIMGTVRKYFLLLPAPITIPRSAPSRRGVNPAGLPDWSSE